MKYECTFQTSGNTKTGKMATFSKMAGNTPIYSNFLQDYVVGSCGHHCEGCWTTKDGKRPPCYVAKSYRYPSVVDRHAVNTKIMREDVALAFSQLNAQQDRMRKQPEFFRYDQSGEIETAEELAYFCNMAENHPNTHYYLYTKNYDALFATIPLWSILDNMTINISVWHKHGIREYLALASYRQIKAFVYVDAKAKNGWSAETYAKHGLVIQTWCTAYDEDGKMDKRVSCDKCQKCIRHNDNCKVIGCNDHS